MPSCWLVAYHEKKCNVIAAPSPASASIATSSGTSSGASSRSPSSSAQSSSSGSSASSVSTTIPGPGRRSFVNKHSNTQIMANMLLSIMDAEDSAELRSSEDAYLARTLSDGLHPFARQGVDSPTGCGRQSSSASSSSKLNGPRESAWHEPPCEPAACEEMFLEPIAVTRGRHSSASKHGSGRHCSPVLRGRASVDGFLTTTSPGPSRQFGNLIDLSRMEISKLRL